MSAGNWDDVLSDYKYAQKEKWGEDLVWMEKLVSYLMANRDLSVFYPVTSHYRLLVHLSNKFEDVYEKPMVLIELSDEQRDHLKDKFRFKFSFTTAHQDGNLYRQYVESVFCSLEKSTDVFDEMIQKLKEFSKSI